MEPREKKTEQELHETIEKQDEVDER